MENQSILEKLPTAADFIRDYPLEKVSTGEYKLNIEQMLIDFGRKCVDIALKAAAKNAQTTSQAIYDFDGTYCCDSCGINEFSILEAFPPDLIK